MEKMCFLNSNEVRHFKIQDTLTPQLQNLKSPKIEKNTDTINFEKHEKLKINSELMKDHDESE